MKQLHYTLACEARREMNRMIESGEWSYTSVANVVIVGEEGVHLFSDNHACHAGLHIENKLGKPKNVVAIVSSVQELLVYEEDALYFYEWLLNDSPYSSVFSTKSASQAVRLGIICRADVPNNLLAGGLIAARLPTEHKVRTDVWVMLARAGICKRMALILAHALYTDGVYMFVRGDSGHLPLTPFNIGEAYVNNFIAGRTYERGTKYNGALRYNTVNATWGIGGQERCSLLSALEDIRLGNREECINPFVKKDESMGLVGDVVPYLVENINSIVNNLNVRKAA